MRLSKRLAFEGSLRALEADAEKAISDLCGHGLLAGLGNVCPSDFFQCVQDLASAHVLHARLATVTQVHEMLEAEAARRRSSVLSLLCSLARSECGLPKKTMMPFPQLMLNCTPAASRRPAFATNSRRST